MEFIHVVFDDKLMKGLFDEEHHKEFCHENETYREIDENELVPSNCTHEVDRSINVHNSANNLLVKRQMLPVERQRSTDNASINNPSINFQNSTGCPT